MTDRIEEVMGLLGTVVTQSCPSDDQILMNNVREAYTLIKEEWRSRQADLQETAKNEVTARVLADMADLRSHFGLPKMVEGASQ